MIVEDGHTRVVAAEKRGDATILVRILGDAQLAGFCTVASVVGEMEGLLEDPVAPLGAGMGLDEFRVAEDAAEDVNGVLGIVEEFLGKVVEDPGEEGVVGVAVEDARIAESLGRMKELIGILEGLEPGAKAVGVVSQPVAEGSIRTVGKVPAKWFRISQGRWNVGTCQQEPARGNGGDGVAGVVQGLLKLVLNVIPEHKASGKGKGQDNPPSKLAEKCPGHNGAYPLMDSMTAATETRIQNR
jgi:hypothetical protein